MHLSCARIYKSESGKNHHNQGDEKSADSSHLSGNVILDSKTSVKIFVSCGITPKLMDFKSNVDKWTAGDEMSSFSSIVFVLR